jgi:tRNA(Arg) A34 adenosine deaminase TadA
METFMREALKSALLGIRKGDGGPFGACLVRGQRVLAVAHNTVLRENDATCHAEMNVIRKASRQLGSWNLSGTTIFSTTEPCPMCFSAIHWARIAHLVFGTTIADVKRLGFRELTLRATTLRRIGGAKVTITEGFLRGECLKLLDEWKKIGGTLY